MRRTLSSLVTALLALGAVALPVGGAARAVQAAGPPPAFAAPAGGTISGQVNDDRGAALAGVSVQVQGASVQYLQTGADGRYLASGLIAGSYRVLVDTGISSPPTYSPLLVHPELVDVTATLGQTGVDFTVPRTAILTGFVRNSSGIAVPNAALGGFTTYTPVGPDGHYVVATTGGDHTVSAGAPGYVGWSNIGSISPGTPVTTTPGLVTNLDFTLDSGGSISGHVVDAAGLPVAGAYISAYQPDVIGYSYGSTATDQSGNYQLKALAAGSYIVSGTAPRSNDFVYFPGTADLNSAGRVTVVDGATTPGIDFTVPVALPLGPPITVTSIAPMVFRRGTTTTATLTGTGFIPGGSVRVDRWGPGPGPTVSFVSVVDSEHLVISVTVPPDALLGNEGGLYLTQRGQTAEFDGGPYVADATSVFGTISGHVTKTSDGTPLANVRVSADQVGGATSVSWTMSLPDGSYVLGPLAPGDYAVRFSPVMNRDLASEFYSDAKSDVTSTSVTVIADADTPSIDAALELADAASITSVTPSVLTPGMTNDVVVTGSGFGIDDTYYIDSGSYYQAAPRVVSKRTISSTEVDLSIQVDPLTPSGPIGIQAPPRGGGAINVCNCLSIATTPESTGTVVGAVTDTGGSGLGSIHVTALADGQTQPTSAGWTAGDGTYALRLPAGTYTLHFEDLGGAAVDVPGVSVTVGQITQGVDGTITPLAFLGGVSGTVTDVTTGLAIGHALVQFTNLTTGYTGGVLADAGGNYHVSTVPIGDYSIEFSAPGYDSRWYADALTAGAAAPVSVVADTVTSSIGAALPSARRPLSVTSIQPNRMAVGETLGNVVVTGSGFVIGNVTNLSFSAGDGVTITAAQATADTSATLSLTVDPAAVPGSRDIVATRDDGQQATCSACLRIFSALGSISGTASLNSSSLSSIMVMATSTTTFERFDVSAGNGGPWTLDRLPVGDYTVQFSGYGYVDQWYANASSLATATPVTVGAAPVTGVDAVLQAAKKYLTLYYTSPASAQQGSLTTVSLYGSGFLDGGVTGLTLDAGVGATVQSINAVSDSSATAVITLASDAPLGMRSLKISRDDGTSSTCTCFQVVPAPGRITGHVTGTNGVVFGFANAYIDGSAVPSVYAPVQPDGSYIFDNLTPGDYRIAFGGYTTNFQSYSPQWWNGAATQASATTVTVAAGQTVTGIDALLRVPSSPLTLYSGYSYAAYQGTTNAVSVFGSGFLNGVTGLAFSAGPGVTIAVNSVDSDAVANVTITTDPGAAPGQRDLVVTRDDGQSATCTGCIDVAAPPPGIVSAIVLDADTFNYLSGTATLTKVGDTTPTWSAAFYASVYAGGLAAGDYDLSIDAAGYQPTVIRVTVVAGQTVYLPNILLQTIRQPLSLTGTSLSVYQGFPQQFIVSGSGFHSGGVTGLSFDGGPDVTISVDVLIGDTAASITVSASATAAAGTRDLTVTRDDGQVAVCTGCLIVRPPDPGSISGFVQASDSYSYLSATITVTAVGATTPTTVVSVSGFYSITGLAAGDYDVLYQSPGYTPLTKRLTVAPGQDTLMYALLDLPRQPLTITSVYPSVVYTGAYYASLQVNGSGFVAGGVTGLTMSLGPNVRVESVYINSDSLAYVYVTVPVEAPLGAYDLVVSRDPGETSTCTGCVTVLQPPGFIYGTVSDVVCCNSFLSTVTATKVGDTVPTATISTYGYYSIELPAGDYIIKADADGYASQWWNHAATEAEAIPVSVASGVTQSGIDFALAAVRAPLSIAYVTPPQTYQGETDYLTVVGSGFLNGGVSALTFGVGGGVGGSVSASVFTIYSDTQAVVGFAAADAAALGSRDLTVTRDDGQTATCTSCLTVVRGQPSVSGVSPAAVREGTRTLTLSGVHMQRVVRVTTSSRKVTVQSYKNNRDGTITVKVKIDGGARKTYTLTFTRDDGVTFTADFSVTK